MPGKWVKQKRGKCLTGAAGGPSIHNPPWRIAPQAMCSAIESGINLFRGPLMQDTATRNSSVAKI
jgi:hypothetical protein